MEILMWLCVLLGIFSLGALWRNQLVYKERIRILNQLSDAAKEDIGRGREWHWRYDALDEISYSYMITRFWIPVKAFFYNHRCLSHPENN